jgi:hypothetical protein
VPLFALGLKGQLFSPNSQPHGPPVYWLGVVQIGVAMALVCGAMTRLSAVAPVHPVPLIPVMTATREMPTHTTNAAPLAESFVLPTTDGVHLFVHGWLRDVPPKAIAQIAHGISEHGGRYAQLAAAPNRAGYGVHASDHRGHGRTARAPEELGFFAERDGWRKCLDDLWLANRHIAAKHPGAPIVLRGHSMGSFLTLDGAITEAK